MKTADNQSADKHRVTDCRYLANKEHLYSELKSEGVILSLTNGRYYGVNEVGACIWQAVQNPASLSEIEEKIKERFDEVDDATCRQEIMTFLEQMSKENLINVIDEKAV